jgi:hypothetical protein
MNKINCSIIKFFPFQVQDAQEEKRLIIGQVFVWCKEEEGTAAD